MPSDRAKLMDEIRKWAALTMISIIFFAGRSQVRDIVRDELSGLQRQVRELELKVAAMEAMRNRN